MPGPYKLGCRFTPKAVLDNHLKLEVYLDKPALPSPPDTFSLTSLVPDGEWGMMLNGPSDNAQLPNGIGDCTSAGRGHLIMTYTGLAGKVQEITDDAVLKFYEIVSGYVPGDENTDVGADLGTCLQDWQKGDGDGHRIIGSAVVNVSDVEEMKAACWLFGGVYCAVQLPANAEQQLEDGKPWTVEKRDGGIAGGHAIVLCGFTAEGPQFITWGQVQPATWAWWLKYGVEAHVAVGHEWDSYSNKPLPNGLNEKQLLADLKEVH